jgi:cytosine/adenosine deaminase-related metal-dependent hydrolase
MPNETLEERHLELLRAIDEVARRDAAGVATMYRAAEGVGLDAVCRVADRQEFVRLVRDLKEAGYVDVQGVTYMGLRASYSVTEEGRRRLEES